MCNYAGFHACRPGRKWKVPAGVKLSDKANAWTVTSKGREEFSKLKAKAIP